jgi:hypothetical protein
MDDNVTMNPASGRGAVRVAVRFFAIVLVCLGAGLTHADTGDAGSGAALRAKYSTLHNLLSYNQFQKPLFLDSRETPGAVMGDIYALVSYPFATVGAALHSPESWCDILILHLNTKFCRASTAGHGRILNVRIGEKHDQKLDEAYLMTLAYRVAAQSPDYLQVRLNADEGPLSTRNYRIVLEATPLENGQTFIHLAYSYGYGLVGRLAMQAYLGTKGSDKVGFTVIGKRADGRPLFIGGMRGVVERNTMRYYLAIEAFLGALSIPTQARLEKRLRDWFAAVSRYPRQLHELERDEYLEMKHREYLRQQAAAPATTKPVPGS